MMDLETKRRAGFTLVELLVVIGIISVLIALLLPALSRVRKQAKAVSCLSQLRQCGVGLQLYANAWNHVMPIGLSRVQIGDGGTGDALYWESFLQGSELYGTSQPNPAMAYISAEAVYYCPVNKNFDEKTPGYYGMPDDDDRNPAMVIKKWGADPTKLSIFPHIKTTRVRESSDFPLLADTTMSITKFPGRGARAWAPNAWAVSANASSRGMIWLAHRDRANVLFVDGHVEACDTERLLSTRIVHSKVAGVTKYGITHWADEKLVLGNRPPK